MRIDADSLGGYLRSEAFGDEAAHEMVDWMHQVVAERADVHRLNELNSPGSTPGEESSGLRCRLGWPISAVIWARTRAAEGRGGPWMIEM